MSYLGKDGWPCSERAFALVILIVMVVAFGLLAFRDAPEMKIGRATVPSCGEEDILIGAGDFADGHWDRLRCEHPDNL